MLLEEGATASVFVASCIKRFSTELLSNGGRGTVMLDMK